MFKKSLAVLLSLFAVLTCACNDKGKAAHVREEVATTSYCKSTLSEGVWAYAYTYDNNMFDYPSGNYNADMAKFALDACVHVYNYVSEGDFSYAYKNLEQTYERLGFTNFYYSQSYTQRPTEDSVAYVIGQKEFSDYTVVFLTIRGFDYYYEWVGNARLGEQGPHDNFNKSADKVLSGLLEYLNAYDFSSKKLKVFVSGFSRGGAIASLVGKKADDMIAAKTITDFSKADFYVYTFSAPPASDVKSDLNNKKYANIINLFNRNDILIRLFSKYGLYRVGKQIDVYGESLFSDFCSTFSSLEISDVKYAMQPSGGYSSYVEFEDFFIDMLACKGVNGRLSISTRKEYCDNFQPALEGLIRLIFSDMDSEFANVKRFAELLGESMTTSQIIKVLDGSGSTLYNACCSALQEVGLSYDEQELLVSCNGISKVLSNCFQSCGTDFLGALLTALNNVSYVICWHVPEMYAVSLGVY